MVSLIPAPLISVIFASLTVTRNSVMVLSRFLAILLYPITLLRILLACAMALSLLIPTCFTLSLILLLFLLLLLLVFLLFPIERTILLMKQFLKILKMLPSIFIRIAHVINHMFCDDVPHISVDDDSEDVL